MSSSPQDILHSFDVLPESEQRVVASEIFRRAAQWESSPLSEDELCQEADSLFQALDQREREDAQR